MMRITTLYASKPAESEEEDAPRTKPNGNNGSKPTSGVRRPDSILRPSKKLLVRKKKQGEEASAAMDLPRQPLIKTIPGGVDAIFRAARGSATTTTSREDSSFVPPWHPQTSQSQQSSSSSSRPTSTNNSTPLTSSQAAALIWRNARKRHKPALWRYALRTLDRMKTRPTNIHYEGALVAAAQLGDGQRALDLYDRVSTSGPGLSITDNMVLSVTRACVRSKDPALLERATEILKRHEHTTTAMHWNPVAAAAAALDDPELARRALDQLPDRRSRWMNEGDDSDSCYDGDEPFDGEAEDQFYVDHVHAKDTASYALAVQVAVGEQDWGAAVDALRTMTTDAALVPTRRQWHRWTEVSGE